MVYRPTKLDEERVREVENHLQKLRRRLQQQVQALLTDVESETIRNQLRMVAFSSNELLPKRRYRPTIKIEHIAEQLHLGYRPEVARTDELLQFTLAFQEYYDIADDLVDDDVADGAKSEVIATNELLLPVVVRLLDRLGENAVSYWADHASQMVRWFVDELLYEPSVEVYLNVLEEQSKLFGVVTGLSAVAAGASDELIERAETIGTAYFKHEQFLLDLEQYGEDKTDPWNAWRLLPGDVAADRLREWQSDVKRLIEDIPEERAELVRAMVAVDIDACREQFV